MVLSLYFGDLNVPGSRVIDRNKEEWMDVQMVEN